jgi:hypothetical protein
LGAVTLGSGLSAVAYALKGTADDRLAATSLAGAASASNTGRAFLPVNTSVKAADLLGSALQYAEFEGLDNDELDSALLYDPTDQHARNQKPAAMNISGRSPDILSPEQLARQQKDASASMVLFARLHDAVFAACSANAYGVIPARKPYR